MKVMLKVTACKGARIESVPLKKLEKAAQHMKRSKEYKDGWLILNAFG